MKLMDSHEEERKAEEALAVSRIKTNPKYFFALGRKYSKVKIGIGPLFDNAKKLVSAPLQMAEILSEQYSSVFSTPVETPTFQDMINNSELNNISFNTLDLEAAMSELSSRSAPGPDGFPSILLKVCRRSLSLPLAKIWRKSLDTGEIPEICKSATITPIYKDKSRAIAKNYRPVALTSHLIKVFEKVLRNHMTNFMHQHNLFNSSQHGFLAGRSCLSQLLNHFDKITSLLENGRCVDVVYLDFAKAFDKVDHLITLQKLSNLGVGGPLLLWLRSFLTNRTQSVLVQGQKSSPKPVISGVPQGSVLGPILFITLLGDIDKDIVSSFLSSFADDTRVGKDISSADDMKKLQDDLDSIYKWAMHNNMQFNSEKFELIRYKPSVKDSIIDNSYKCDKGKPITECPHVRDLGITMSNDATFAEHLIKKCTAVRNKIAWVLRTFSARDSRTMLTLWKTQVIFHLEYCSQLWSLTKTGSIQSLELLQKAFFKQIKGMYNLNYWEQLSALKSYSLERRRERYRCIYTWRIVEGQVPNFDGTPIVTYNHKHLGRRCKVPKPRTPAPCKIKTIRDASLPFMGPRLFNSLPKYLRDLKNCDVTKFKKMLDRFLASVPDEPLIPRYTHMRRIDSNSIIDWTASPYVIMPEHDMQHSLSEDSVAEADTT